MSNIKIELDEKYRESLDLLKQMIPNANWEEITDDGEMVWVLIESFMAFIQDSSCECGEECDCWDDCDCEGGDCK